MLPLLSRTSTCDARGRGRWASKDHLGEAGQRKRWAVGGRRRAAHQIHFDLARCRKKTRAAILLDWGGWGVGGSRGRSKRGVAAVGSVSRAQGVRRSARLTVGAQWAKRILRFCTTVITPAIFDVVRVRRAVVAAQGRWGGWRRRWPATALEDDLVYCNVAVKSGPPARALAGDAEANLSCAGRDIHVHLLPVIVARPAHASCVLRHMEHGAPAGAGAGGAPHAAREPFAWWATGGLGRALTSVLLLSGSRSPRYLSNRRRAHTPAGPNVPWLKRGT